MNDEEKLLMQRLSARVDELEMWLALLVVNFGYANDPGMGTSHYLYVSRAEVDELRAQLDDKIRPAVYIDYDTTGSYYRIDTL